ncbi:MAG TPA: hypothetical protein VNY29_15985 [Terriglobales bacterium]|nr:hypothetical protein [Terriglobales bacterium]
MRWFAPTLVLCLAIVLPARALDDPPHTPAYLVRLERMHVEENACVLVRSDGRYHYERSAHDQTVIFEGTIAQPDLERLRQWAGENELVALTQDKIVEPVFAGPKDQLLLSVDRPEHWQNLSFPAPPTWQRYTRSVVPLAQWLNQVKKVKYRVKLREEQGRNYCTPPHEPELMIRSHQTVVPFVLLSRTTSFKGKDGEEQCAVVYPDGRYHRETKSQRSGSTDVATAVYEGSFEPDRMQALRDILGRPEIQNRPEMYPPHRTLQTGGEVTSLTLSVHGKTRTLLFWKYDPVFDLKGKWRVAESGVKALEPLRQWLRLNVDAPDGSPLENARLSDCVPPRQP